MSDESLYVSNNIIKFFVILSRLIDCNNPRGIFMDYKRATEYINILKSNPFPKTFDKTLSNFVNQQYKYRQPHDSFILEKLKEDPSIETLERELKYFLNKNIPDYISEETSFINSQLISHKTSKNALLENSISSSIELLLLCNENNFKLMDDFIAWLSQRQIELEN